MNIDVKGGRGIMKRLLPQESNKVQTKRRPKIYDIQEPTNAEDVIIFSAT